MRDIIKSFGVKYNHNGARSWAATDIDNLSRRDEHTIDEVFNVGFNPQIDSRLALFPPNTTLDDSVAEAVIRCVSWGVFMLRVTNYMTSQLTDAQIDLTCVDCAFTTNITVGIDFQVDIADSSCITGSTESCFTLTSAAMNFTVEQFEQDAALELFISKGIQAGTDYK